MGVAEAYRGPSGKTLPGPTASPDEIVKRLRSLFEKERRGLLAYLFGSYARGEVKEGSDLDLAVLLEPDVTGEALCDTYQGLFLEVRRRLGSERFDLLLLNRAPLSLKFEVVSQGRLIYARDDETLNRFEMDVIRKYQDTAHLRAVQEGYLRERVRRWYSKGKTFVAYIEWDPETRLYVGIVPGVPGAHTQGAILD